MTSLAPWRKIAQPHEDIRAAQVRCLLDAAVAGTIRASHERSHERCSHLSC